MKTYKSLFVLAICLLVSASAMAQDQTGSIFGTITTEDGAAIVGVKVTAMSPALIRPMVTRTNDRGYYVFPALPVGEYTIKFEKAEYQATAYDGINLMLGQQLRLNPSLKAGVVGEEVITVTGEAPLIDTKSTETGMTLNKELFNALPKGRNFTSLVELSPGASDENIGAGLMIDGATAVENVWVVDGVDISSMYSGKPTASAVFEFVEEVQVRSGGYEAEFGGSMGGVVNVITRSGGNEFHGEGTFYFNNDALDGDRRPILRFDPVDDVTPRYFEYDKDEYTRTEFGGGIGGYLLKDRVWFFGAYLPNFTDRTRTVGFENAAGQIFTTQSYDTQFTQHNAQGKVTAQLTDSIRASFSATNDWSQSEGNLPDIRGIDPVEDPGYDEIDTFPGYGFAGNVDFSVTDSLFTNVKGGWHRTDHTLEGLDPQVRYRNFGFSMNIYSDHPAFASIPADRVLGAGGQNVGPQSLLVNDTQTKMNLSWDATYYTQLGGEHVLKGGFQWYRIQQDVADTYVKDYIIIYPGLAQTNPAGQAVAGEFGVYRVVTGHPQGFGTVAEVESDRYALFAQDSWGITDRLTVNIGVRTESESVPSFSDLAEFSETPLEWGFGDKLSPRFGFAYDVSGDGTFKIFGNYARYYDVMKLSMAEGSYGGFKWIDRWYTLDTLEYWTIGGDIGSFPRSNIPGDLIISINNRIPSFDTTQPDSEPTSVDEFMLGAEYLLADNLSVSARFVHKRLNEIIEDAGFTSPAAGGELFFIGNPGSDWIDNEFEKVNPYNGSVPDLVDPTRHYWGLELRATKNFSNNWTGGAALTLSRLTGNISGLASTDEFGREDSNVNRYYDHWWADYDASWNIIDDILPTDRRYSLDLYASYVFDFGLTLGLFQNIADGNPISTMIDLEEIGGAGHDGYMPFGRGDQGRYDIWTATNIYAEYNFNIGDYRAQINMNIDNLFDQETAWRKSVELSRDDAPISGQTLIDSFNSNTPIDVRGLIDGIEVRNNGAYLMDNGFQGPRSIRLGFKFIF